LLLITSLDFASHFGDSENSVGNIWQHITIRNGDMTITNASDFTVNTKINIYTPNMYVDWEEYYKL
jgi:hypothetical protein